MRAMENDDEDLSEDTAERVVLIRLPENGRKKLISWYTNTWLNGISTESEQDLLEIFKCCEKEDPTLWWPYYSAIAEALNTRSKLQIELG